jgi:protein NrfC
MDEPRESSSGEITRRKFLMGTGTFVLVASVGGAFILPGKMLVMADAEGFLLVDLKKCQGCGSCKMACALAHSGVASFTLSRVQIQQDSFQNWPDDVFMAVCRQCKDAPCVQVCPVSANRPDPQNGNVRLIDTRRCIGCRQCIEACPYTPKRLQWDPMTRKAQKCDLCRDTPYLGEKGGPGGTQACVKVCPVGAFKFSREMPDQKREDSYQVNLRGPAWAKLGISVE